MPDEFTQPLPELLASSVPADSVLYRVLARARPVSGQHYYELAGADQHVADLVLVGSLTTSRWGVSCLQMTCVSILCCGVCRTSS